MLCGVGEKGGRERKELQKQMYYYGVCVTACRSKEKKEKQGGGTETYFSIIFCFLEAGSETFPQVLSTLREAQTGDKTDVVMETAPVPGRPFEEVLVPQLGVEE